MADRLLYLSITTAVLCSSFASPEYDHQIHLKNTTYPTTVGGTLNLTCYSNSDDYDLEWAFDGSGDDLIYIERRKNKYIITYDEGRETNLTVMNVQPNDEGVYYCYASNHDDYVYSSYAFNFPPVGGLKMEVKPRLDPKLGDDVSIKCTAEGVSEKIVWIYIGPNLRRYTSQEYKELFGLEIYVANTINRTGSYLELYFKGIDIQNSGIYTCMAGRDTVSSSLMVNGYDLNCEEDTLYVYPGSDATFRCKIITLDYIERSDISIRKTSPSIKDPRPLDYTRETFNIWKEDDDRITYYFKLQVNSVILANDATKYKINIDNDDLEFELSLMIEFDAVPEHCHSRCPGNYICSAAGTCICPQGYKPDPQSRMNCIERESDDDDDSAGGDVTIVKHSAVATAVGVSMGVLGFIILVILGFVCYWRRKKQKLNTQGRGHYLDPSYMYQYEYHSEANTLKENPTVCNPGYQMAPPRITLRKENTYVDTEKEPLEFPREQLQLGVDLGQGRFGKVIQARAMNICGSGKWERVAVKTCRGTATDSEKQDLYQELEIMRKIPAHPNIVLLLGCCSNTDPLYIIMEYVQRGSMLNYLRRCRPSSRISRDSAISSLQTNSSFMEPRAKDLTIFALQIARGMSHIGAVGIIHRDLAARNILLGTDFTCKICDFGLARDVEGVDVYERTSKGPLPIRWMAPEALAENMYTRKSDVWSYGVLLWEIVTLGATPYTGMSAMEVMRHVLQGYNLPRPLHCKEEMYELMERCWVDSDQRPTFADIVSHHEALMDDDYIVLSDYDENDYGWLDSYTLDERV